MNYDNGPAFQTMSVMNAAFDETVEPAFAEDESPIMAHLRGKLHGKNQISTTKPTFNQQYSNQSTYAETNTDDDEDSLCPLDAFDGNDDVITVDDADELVDFALRISEDSVSTGFHESVNSGFSLDDKSINDLINGMDDDEVDMQDPQGVVVVGPGYQDNMESLNQSIASLNDAFEKLSSCMDRTAESRIMLKKLTAEAPIMEALSREGSQRSLLGGSSIRRRAAGGLSRSGSNQSLNSLGQRGRGGPGLSRSGSNASLRRGGLSRTGSNQSLRRGVTRNSSNQSLRRGGLTRSGSNKSLNSVGSNRSMSSLGRKSIDKTTRKLRRNMKTDLRSELRADLTRGGFSTVTGPQQMTPQQMTLLYDT